MWSDLSPLHQQTLDLFLPDRYVVLDIEPVRGYQNQGRWILAEVQVAKESDFGRNDKVYFAKTHLGHLLNPGVRVD